MGDGDLVMGICRGDAEAFAALVHKYANAVYGTAYHRIGDFHLAQDIAQEVFIKAFLKLGELKDPEKVGSWLYAVTQRMCMDRLRSNRPASPLNEALHAEVYDETRFEVWQALEALPEASRLPLILYHIGGYSTAEIARFLGISSEAVESRLRRARKAMRRELLGMVGDNLVENRLGDDFEVKVKEMVVKYWESSSLGKQKDALKQIREAVNLKPHDPQLREYLANTLLTLGQNEDNKVFLGEAETIYRDLAERDPNCYQGLGQVYMAMNELDKAIDCFIKLTGKRHADATNFLAEAYLKKGDFNAVMGVAQGALLNALSIGSGALFNLVKAAQGLKDVGKARRYCHFLRSMADALGDEPGIPMLRWYSYLLSAELELSGGNIPAALEAIGTAKALAKRISESGPAVIFDRLGDILSARSDEGTDLEWFLQMITSDMFQGLKGNDEFEKLVGDTKSDIKMLRRE